jgi:hypothetical protein
LTENLIELVEQGRISELLQRVSPDDIAAAWCRYHSTDEPIPDGEDPDWWAVELWLSPAWWTSPQRIREELVRLIDAAPDDSTLAAVGAGPLEAFLTDDPKDLQWLEEQAMSSTRFRTALAIAHIPSSLSQEAASRIKRASGAS